jgi:ribosomal-protein-alanine N-acetyltransferase
MKEQPTLICERLLLRPFLMGDVAQVTALVGERDIASTTLAIPHPYDEAMAEEWIMKHPARYQSGRGVNYAIVIHNLNTLAGAIGLQINIEHRKAELGYWIGKPFWGNGYATEASKKLIQFGFEELDLNRIYASHFVRNPASGYVLRNSGMEFEGRRRQDILKWGQFEDSDYYAILKNDYQEV